MLIHLAKQSNVSLQIPDTFVSLSVDQISLVYTDSDSSFLTVRECLSESDIRTSLASFCERNQTSGEEIVAVIKTRRENSSHDECKFFTDSSLAIQQWNLNARNGKQQILQRFVSSFTVNQTIISAEWLSETGKTSYFQLKNPCKLRSVCQSEEKSTRKVNLLELARNHVSPVSMSAVSPIPTEHKRVRSDCVAIERSVIPKLTYMDE
jgi:hypothetical protein